jgi:hypothetical protein
MEAGQKKRPQGGLAEESMAMLCVLFGTCVYRLDRQGSYKIKNVLHGGRTEFLQEENV